MPERRLAYVQRPERASPKIYTLGYEGKSVDTFFNDLLTRGIDLVVDVRANPVSRKYGFSRLRFSEICAMLGIEYRHIPSLGIPSNARVGLGSFASYQTLLSKYEHSMLPERWADVEEVGRLMRHRPAVLLCVEKDVRCGHRSGLAQAVARATDLEVVHL